MTLPEIDDLPEPIRSKALQTAERLCKLGYSRAVAERLAAKEASNEILERIPATTKESVARVEHATGTGSHD